MDMPPLATTQGRRVSTVPERKLDELSACLGDALSSTRQRGPNAERRLVAEIKAKTDFLRSLLVAEAECHGGGGARPEYLAEAEARFAVLEETFHNWARRAAAAASPEPVEEEDDDEKVREPAEEEETDGSESSGSTCSCTDWCQEAAPGDAIEARKEVTAADGIASNVHDDEDDAEREATGTRRVVATSGAVAEKREAVGTRDDDDGTKSVAFVSKKRDAAADTRGRTVQRQRWWWRRGAAWCGAAGVVALVAVGLTLELAAVAHQNVNVYVVPT
ncbi:hypothetical protein HU200_042477 [Digitaria exilis]|uniref:DUF7610 domain-containing protein n=1 Tax=Digitaria exilis TaxID=1010633 RepID=A0A835ECV2_9POAL|nr:hypothetical protein HU200_042477 [Digitaria exilis]